MPEPAEEMPPGPESDSSSEPVTFLPARHGKNPDLYQRGDDISEYFGHGIICVPTYPSQHQDALDALDKARAELRRALLDELDAFGESITWRGKFIKEYGDWNRDYIFAMRPGTEPLPLPGIDRGTSGGSAQAATSPESRKSRLEGVDVTALPAGFGKRRQTSGGGGSLKKPKTPNASAPELVPGSTVESPENS